MESIAGISIGILVIKDNPFEKKDKNHLSRANIIFINIEEHKEFVKNLFSIKQKSPT